MNSKMFCSISGVLWLRFVTMAFWLVRLHFVKESPDASAIECSVGIEIGHPHHTLVPCVCIVRFRCWPFYPPIPFSVSLSLSLSVAFNSRLHELITIKSDVYTIGFSFEVNWNLSFIRVTFCESCENFPESHIPKGSPTQPKYTKYTLHRCTFELGVLPCYSSSHILSRGPGDGSGKLQSIK